MTPLLDIPQTSPVDRLGPRCARRALYVESVDGALEPRDSVGA